MARKGRNRADAAELERQASKIFTPGNPISVPRLFSGRDEVIKFLGDEFGMNPRKCLVLYGERGVGKTSFCNVLFDGRGMLKHNCSKSDDFVTIFLNILSKAGEQFTESERKVLADAGYKIGSDNMLSIEAKVGAEEVDKPVAQQKLDLNFVLRRFLKANAGIDVIFLDEFQNISESSIQSGIIEVVKGIADDEDTEVVTVIAGIADADTELLTSQDYEQYKGRHFVAQKLPRMQLDELNDIIDRRRDMFKIQFDDGQKRWIAYIAAGLPQYVHKVALSAVFFWIAENISTMAKNLLSRVVGFLTVKRPKIDEVDVRVSPDQFGAAVRRMIKEFETNYPDAYTQFLRMLESDQRDALMGALRHLAAGLGEPTALPLGSGGAEGKRAVAAALAADLPLLAEEETSEQWKLAQPQFASYIRSWECLEAEYPSEVETLRAAR